MIARLLPALLLAACAAVPRAPAIDDPAPRAVTLYRDTLTVEMADGSLCTGVRPGRAGPWRTELAGCAHRWPVAVLRPSDRPRLPLIAAPDAPWVELSPPGAPVLGFGPRVGS